jgi:hypothetical protein
VDFWDDYARRWQHRYAVSQDESAHLWLSLDDPVEGLGLSALAYVPLTTSAGHFLSMQPAVGTEPRDKQWYRADGWDTLTAERDKYRSACQAVLRLFTEAPDPEVLDILDIVEKVLK